MAVKQSLVEYVVNVKGFFPFGVRDVRDELDCDWQGRLHWTAVKQSMVEHAGNVKSQVMTCIQKSARIVRRRRGPKRKFGKWEKF